MICRSHERQNDCKIRVTHTSWEKHLFFLCLLIWNWKRVRQVFLHILVSSCKFRISQGLYKALLALLVGHFYPSSNQRHADTGEVPGWRLVMKSLLHMNLLLIVVLIFNTVRITYFVRPGINCRLKEAVSGLPAQGMSFVKSFPFTNNLKPKVK